MKTVPKVLVGILAFFGGILVLLFVYKLFLGAKEATQKSSPQTAGEVQPAAPPEPSADPQAKVFDDMGFRMSYPADWVFEKPNGYTVVFSGAQGSPSYYATVNMQIIATTKAGGKHETADTLIADLREQIMTAQEPNVTDATDQSFTNTSGQLVSATGFAAAYTRDNKEFRQLQFASPSADGNSIYAYSYTAPKDLYEEYKPVAITMIQSLELIK